MTLVQDVITWSDGTPVTRMEVIIGTVLVIAAIVVIDRIFPRKRK